MIKVIGFDLDNTLYNQEDFEFAIFKLIAKKISNNFDINEKMYLHELIKLYKGNEKEYIFDKAYKNIVSTLPLIWEDFVKNSILPMYRTFKPTHSELYEGVIENLEELKNKNFKLVLITNGNSDVQNNKINVLGIRKYFDLILISDDYIPKRRKPDIHMFQESLQYFQINSDEMIFIGDDLIRDKASEQIGITFIHVNDFDTKKIGEYNEK